MAADWFRDAFDDLYLTVYRHRDGEEASRLISWLAPALNLGDSRVLDLACGGGRFLQPLLEAGVSGYTGLDLSRPLLDAARSAHSGPRVSFVRGDMRCLPYRDGSFHAVVSMFTSLGYFADDAENAGVFREMSRVSSAGGRVAIDVLNPSWLRSNLVPASEREVAGYRIVESRAIEAGRVDKSVAIFDHEGERVRAYTESVRLLEEDLLVEWATAAGLSHTGSYGDYDGGPVTGAASPRLILTFSKADLAT